MPFGEQQGIAIVTRKFINETSNTGAEVRQFAGRFGCRCNSLRQRLARTQFAEVIGDGIAGDAPDPCFEAFAGPKVWEFLVNLYEDVLEDVFSGGVVSHAGADECAELAGKFVPDAFDSGGHSMTVGG